MAPLVGCAQRWHLVRGAQFGLPRAVLAHAVVACWKPSRAAQVILLGHQVLNTEAEGMQKLTCSTVSSHSLRAPS